MSNNKESRELYTEEGKKLVKTLSDYFRKNKWVVTLNPYTNGYVLWSKDVDSDKPYTIGEFDELRDDKKTKLFEKYGVKNLTDLNKAIKNKFIDEKKLVLRVQEGAEKFIRNSTCQWVN